MRTEEILEKLNESLDRAFAHQAQVQSNKKNEWLKTLLNLSPWILTTVVSFIIAFTNMKNRIDNFEKSTNQIRIEEEERARKVDYNFSIINQKHPELTFFPTITINK